jgi:hypothetical protein
MHASLSRVSARGRRPGALLRLCAIAACAATLGCSPEQVLGGGTGDLPPKTPDPSQTKTPAGALAAYYGTLVQFRNAFGARFVGGIAASYVGATGLLTDELQSATLGAPIGVYGTNNLMRTDSRMMPEYATSDAATPSTTDGLYQALHFVRAQASEARGLLTRYAPGLPTALDGHLAALTGYSEVFLAELYCSGVPLSTVDFEGDYTYQPGSTTDEIFTHAIVLFDTALTLAADSARVVSLAKVGKGRALLALGRYADAAQAVADVPTDFVYATQYSGTATDSALSVFYLFTYQGTKLVTVGSHEGVNGLDFVGSNDPRIPTATNGSGTYGLLLYRPTRSFDGGVTVASGVEARLIEAEAALHAGDASWLDQLNALRTDGTFDTQPDPVDTTQTDTLWHAGTGGVAGLAPLADPGTDSARVDLLFRERAFWLYLTGHRQGDLRRLIRQYGREPESVYPTGNYQGADGAYGPYVTAPVPPTERSNPKFTGCFNREA